MLFPCKLATTSQKLACKVNARFTTHNITAFIFENVVATRAPLRDKTG